MMERKELEEIRRRWEEFNYQRTASYRAFMFCAHQDVGKLLAEVDRYRDLHAELESQE